MTDDAKIVTPIAPAQMEKIDKPTRDDWMGFRAHLVAEYNTEGLPVGVDDAVFDTALQDALSDGYYEVSRRYGALAELAEKIVAVVRKEN